MPAPSFPSGNRLVLDVRVKSPDFGSTASPGNRGEVTVRGDAKALLAELGRMIALNAEFTPGSLPWSLVFWGEFAPRDGSPFWKCVTAEALFPVTVRRKAWAIERICKYTSIAGAFCFEVYDVTGESTFAPASLTAEDFAADDWEVVDNPNNAEIDLDDDDPVLTPELRRKWDETEPAPEDDG